MSQQSAVIDFPKGMSASKTFLQLLTRTQERFQSNFTTRLPGELKSFKKNFAEALAAFESQRLASSERGVIAKDLAAGLLDSLVMPLPEGAQSLRNYMLVDRSYLTATNPQLETRQFTAKRSPDIRIPYAAREHRLSELTKLAQLLRSTRKITNKAADALKGVNEHYNLSTVPLDLAGQRFVIFGASAELAPTRLLLGAGADILWIDRAAPDFARMPCDEFSGSLSYFAEGCDLLSDTRSIASAIYQFTATGPAHFGLFAYAGGRGRELRLTAAMNSIVEAIPGGQCLSVAMYVSPTSIAILQPEDAAASEDAKGQLKFWQKLCRATGTLHTPMIYRHKNVKLARAIVPLQGLSYQAAQYIGKTLTAESWQTFGHVAEDAPVAEPRRVSVNIAGITKTRSLNHPIFQAAFLGAPRFNVDIFEVDTTNTLAALLMIHDCLVKPSSSVAELFSKQIHGGIYTSGYALDPMIKIATLLGLAARPKLFGKAGALIVGGTDRCCGSATGYKSLYRKVSR